MYAITFDLIVAELEKSHPKRINRAYDEVRKTLARNGFVWKQGSVYLILMVGSSLCFKP